MRDMDEIKRVVRDTLSADFDRVRIIDVVVQEDEDTDGDEFLHIEVVFAGTPKDLDARKLSGAVRHLRPKLSEIKEFAFPLLSFISAADVERRRLDPA